MERKINNTIYKNTTWGKKQATTTTQNELNPNPGFSGYWLSETPLIKKV